jgi:hypothetical protein
LGSIWPLRGPSADRWVYVVAGAAAGTRTVLIERDYSLSATSSGSPPANFAADLRSDCLSAAAAKIDARRSAT